MITIANTLQLHEITLDDFSELNELMEDIYPPAYKHLWKNEDCNWYLTKCYSFSNLKEELQENEAKYFFVIDNSKKIGILRFIFNHPLKEFSKESSTYLHRIYLAQEAQGKGIAQQLFHWVEKEAKGKNNHHIWLEVMDTQKQALKFYKKLGFKEIAQKHLEFNRLHEHLRGMFILLKDLA